jgi:predicted nucleotidyltransferase
MAAVIHQVIPGSEVRLFGSRARGQAGADSDIDLLITAPDSWLEHHHRFAGPRPFARCKSRGPIALIRE